DQAVAWIGEPDPDLSPKKDSIRTTINQEAARCQRTLNEGMERFERIGAKHPKLISGADAFLLHDTFGFPIDLTRELAAERDLEVDEEGFRAAMAAQKERSRRGLPTGWVTAKHLPKTEFSGYHELPTATTIVAVRRAGTQADH